MEITRRAKVDAYYDDLLARLPGPLADRLRAKFTQDEEGFIAAAVAACPTTEGVAWADPSCKKCHGTGCTGVNKTPGHSNFNNKIACKCPEKRYMRWMRNFREEYNRMRDNNGQT